MLVNCVAYQDGRKLADIRKEEISEYVKRPECFVWVAMKDPAEAEIDEMAAEFGLHALAVEDAKTGHQRPKIEEYGDSLFGVLHTLQLRGEQIHVGEVDVFIGRNYILSVRRDTEPGFSAVRARAESEPELLRHGSGFVFYALMDNIVDRYFPIVDALEVELEKIEERIFDADSPRGNMRRLYELKHQLMVMRHAVEPLIEAIHKLYGGRVPMVCAGLGEYFRDVYDHLVRLNQEVDSMRDTVTTAIQVNLATITINESEVTKRLASYAALVAVPTMIAGVYGMNFENMPELKWTYGYPLVMGVMAALDGFLFYRFKKAGWI